MPFPIRRTVAASPLPYDPCSPPGLAARWVQWVAAAGLHESPLEDRTGEHGAAHQPPDVWFLAGCRGGRVHRRVAVPGGRDLFFPMVNWWFRADRVPDLAPVLARVHGSVAVDGRPVQPELVVTPEPFTVVGARFNDITLRAKPRSIVTGGLWTSVPVLPAGVHEVHIEAGDGDDLTLDVRYELLVTAPGATTWP